MTLLAGCTGQSDSGTSGGDDTADGTTDGSTDSETSTGSFRLLISDRPADIGDFDSLNVSFDRARVFGGETGDEEDDQAEPETQNETNESETEEDEGDNEQRGGDEDQRGEDTEDGEGNGEGGFSIIDLGGATVDLTEVVGEKAIGVFDGELSAGQYSKIELYASNVEGVVDGQSVGVKIPSGKLQIVKPFRIVPNEPVSFVFDINVVKKGNKAEYNLLPVISESGVADKDVEIEEVDQGRGNDRDGNDDDEPGDRAEPEDNEETNNTADGGEMNSNTESGTETAADEQ